jgi:hypothetical protein
VRVEGTTITTKIRVSTFLLLEYKGFILLSFLYLYPSQIDQQSNICTSSSYNMSSPPMLEESRIQICHDDADVDLPITPTPRTTSPEPDVYARFFDTMDQPSIRMLLDGMLLLLVVMGLLCASSSVIVTEKVPWPTATLTSTTD